MAVFSWLKRKDGGQKHPTAAGNGIGPDPDIARQAPAGASTGADQQRIFELGVEMLRIARENKSGLLSAKFYNDKLMDWSMKDQAFKVQLFRFVDAFPMLRNADDVYEHLRDYLSQPGVRVPAAMELGIKAGGVAKGLAVSQISKQIEGMAKKFIAGTDAAGALPRLERLWKDGIAFSVDLLGEACVSDAEADMYRDKYLDLVGNLPATVSGWAGNQRLERDHLGVVPRTNVSVKISSLSAKSDPIDTEGAIADLLTRIEPILEVARDKGVLINFDMEHHDLKELTLELFRRCCQRIDFHAGLAMQAYLRSGVEDAKSISAWAQQTGRQVTVRLVKGAYWDSEVIHAEERGWACPVWSVKRETDACFERMTEAFLDACPRSENEGGVKLALGSHNVRSIAAALTALEDRGLPREAIELQMLHGMADELKEAGARMGLRVREYVPVGEMIPGMAYLVRRLLENTSNESWLKAGFLDNADPALLLRSPHGASAENGTQHKDSDLYKVAAERHALSDAVDGVGDGKAFVTEPLRDFTREDHRADFAGSIARAIVPGVANDTSVERALDMIARAERAFPSWRDRDPVERSNMLVRAAEIMRARRDELSGVMIKEAGKTWREADADVCEAIDFCEYYARRAPGLFSRTRLGRFIGELDETWYQPRGVGVVISPWNFPLAICCGMTVAGLVCGNPMIVKPAEQTPGIAKILCDILWQAGVPQDVLHFCPAPGETVGAALVRDPRVAIIAFTGSKAVGLDILAAAGVTHDQQHHVKKVVCEMGGKNAIIVDTSADLDEAVLGVRSSAFGFQGQKCSACSRLIIVDPDGQGGQASRHVIQRLVDSTRSLVIGDPVLPGTDVGPVIDEQARDKIRSFIDTARQENTLELAMDLPPGIEHQTGRAYVAPHIFSGVTRDSAIWREEIFGPVLGVTVAKTFDEALQLANDSVYKLTGGVFSRMPKHLEQAKREFRVGNLYLNRGCTGALVARQPFGGFGMSGVGSKAGGVDYLLQFVEPRASCENMIRRGFAPELSS